MALKNYLKRLIFGITIPQEYVCLADGEIQDLLTVTATGKLDNYTIDVSSSHIFLGYKPVIIGLSLETNEDIVWIRNQQYLFLSFSHKNKRHRIDNEGSDMAVGTLALEKMTSDSIEEDPRLFLFTAVHGEHLLLSGVHQFTNRVVSKLKRKGANNIDLKGNLTDQVRIAYAVPRSIALITVLKNGCINIFPTDLHGRINKTHYVSSLRIGGIANEQVEETKNILLCFVDVNNFKDVYALGKNHMKDYQPFDHFKLTPLYSSQFEIPIPHSCVSYIELQQIKSVDIGIHRIHIYKIIAESTVREAKALTHVHQYYVEWRRVNNLTTKLFLR